MNIKPLPDPTPISYGELRDMVGYECRLFYRSLLATEDPEDRLLGDVLKDLNAAVKGRVGWDHYYKVPVFVERGDVMEFFDYKQSLDEEDWPIVINDNYVLYLCGKSRKVEIPEPTLSGGGE